MFCSLILIPLFAVILMNLPFRVVRRSAFWFGLVLFVGQIYISIFPPEGVACYLFKFSLIVDELSRVVLFCVGIVLFTALFVGQQMLKDEEQRFNFINLLIIAMAGLNGVTMVNDVFSLYVFLEITAIASFILICFKRDANGLEAAFKYFILSVVASVLMLTSIAMLLLIAGDTSFAAINSVILVAPHNSFFMLAMGLFICGLFIKGGLVPFHGWLPDAYSAAPTPVSVLLAGVVTKTVGVYALIRIVTLVFIFDSPIKLILLFIGAVSILVGALAALGQSDFKRMLAYSSISQVGYIVIGLGCGTPLGIFGAVFHLLNHSIFKSLLFVNAAAVEEQTGSGDMDKMSGLAQKMPVTGVTSVLACLSAAGIPPLSGFWSKLLIILALWMAGYYTYAIIAVLAGLITLAYLLSLQRRVFFGILGKEFVNIKEAGFGIIFPAVILAALIVVIGLLFPFLIGAFNMPTGMMGG